MPQVSEPQPDGQRPDRTERAVAYRFGDFEIDPGLFLLRRDGASVEIQPKVLDLLIYLARHRDRVVPKDEILEALWPGIAATDDVLSRAVHAARHAVDDDGEHQRIIETVRGRGFRFVVAVECLDPSESASQFMFPETAATGLPFVGRSQALSRLHAAFADAKRGHGRIALLAGEAGIGKTRLLEEFTRGAAAKGAKVSAGWCWEGDGAPPYWPWIQVLRDMMSSGDPDQLRAQIGRGALDLARIVPSVREIFPELPEVPHARSDEERFRLFDSVTRFLCSAADANAPQILILDDLQWADRPSLKLIEFMVRQLAKSPLLVLGAYQERALGAGRHPLMETLGVLARQTSYEQLFLEGLAAQDVSELLEASIGREPSERLLSTVYDKTDGNPFLVMEIVRLLESDPEALETGRQGNGVSGLPRGVTAVVQRRLASLSPPVRQVLSLAAIVGREFTRDLLKRALSSELQYEPLEEALRLGLTVEVPGTPGRYRFSHGLIREALYDEIGAVQRAAFHRRVAEALEGIQEPGSDADVSTIAFHYTAAAGPTEFEKAFEYAKQAGRDASRKLAYEEAASHFHDALEILTQREAQTARERCELLIANAKANRRAGEFKRAREAWVNAADLAREFEMPELLAIAALGVQGAFPWLSASIDTQEVTLLEEALLAVPKDQLLTRASLLARLAVVLYWSENRQRALQLSEEAIEIARRSGDPAARWEALSAQYYLWARPDSLREQFDLTPEIERLAHESGDPEAILMSHLYRMEGCLKAGDLRGYKVAAQKMTRVAAELRQPLAQWVEDFAIACDRLREGQIQQADAATEAACTSLEVVGNPQEYGVIGPLQRLAVRSEQRDVGSCEAAIRSLAESYPNASLWPCVLLDICVLTGREAEARERFEALAADDFSGVSQDDAWLVSMHHLANGCVYLQDRERAAQLYRHLLPHDGRMVALSISMFHGPVAGYLGSLAATAGRHEEAVKHFNDAIASSRSMEAPIWRARFQCHFASALMARGRAADREQATELVKEALATATELGAAALEAQASALL